MTNGLALFAYWSVRRKENRVSSAQFSSVRDFRFTSEKQQKNEL